MRKYKELSPKEVRRLWIKALKSGKYNQGRGYLATETYRGTEFCCLGVLCDLAEKRGVIGEHRKTNTVGQHRSYADNMYLLSRKVRLWVGLRSSNGEFASGPNGVKDSSLIDLNDSGNSFEQIAEVIKSKPEGLFVDPKYLRRIR